MALLRRLFLLVVPMASFVLVAGSCSNEGEDSANEKSINGDQLESASLKILGGQTEAAISELEADRTRQAAESERRLQVESNTNGNRSELLRVDS